MSVMRNLRMNEVNGTIGEALKEVGFRRYNRSSTKLVKTINPETQAFIFLGVSRKQSRFFIDPVIGLYNSKLSDRAQFEDESQLGDCRIFSLVLGLRAGWDRLLVDSPEALIDAASAVKKAIVEIGMPIFLRMIP